MFLLNAAALVVGVLFMIAHLVEKDYGWAMALFLMCVLNIIALYENANPSQPMEDVIQMYESGLIECATVGSKFICTEVE